VANTIMPTVFSSGVRRMRTLSGWPMMGALGTAVDPSTIADLVVNGGYDMGTINTLAVMGASNEQLLALPYPASSAEMAAAVSNLMNRLGGAQAAPGAPATSAGSYPKGAIPTVDTSYGTLDLSLRSTWDYITGLFTQAGQGLNALAAQRPNDPRVIQMRAQYNSLAKQFSDTWSRVFNSASPVQTLAAWQDVAVDTGIVIVGGVAIASGVGIPLALGMAALLAGLWTVQRWIESQNLQTAVTQTAAATQAQLAKALADAQAKGDTATANQILKTMAVTGSGSASSAPTNWSVWLQQNMGLLIFGLAAVVIAPPLLRRR
jgi:hypothetical protein